ncbi:MAG: hypothetical protein COA73_12095 [Candidatus Hydrogenedentota bacterium]|nr:MAG: hypothetical protein COA73_12095 [Candidatus Hydrogenedentota bacterium]
MRKSTAETMEQIAKILAGEKMLSINQIAKRIHSEWDTTRNTLETMKNINLVQEHPDTQTKRKSRFFNLRKPEPNTNPFNRV